METLRGLLNKLRAFNIRKRCDGYSEAILVEAQGLGEIVNRIDKEIESIDNQINTLKTAIERDLIDLYNTYKSQFEALGYQTQANFNASYRNRIIDGTKASLYQAKEELERLKIEIMRVCVSSA